MKCKVNCDSLRVKLRVKFEFIHGTIDILSSLRSITRYSTGANKYKPISTWMVDSHELEHHPRLVQHMMAESWIPSPIDIYERVRYIRTISSTWIVESHELEHHWWLSPGLLPWVTSIIWLSNYLFPVQWNTVTALTVAWIVQTINFYTHFSKNTNLETDTSLPII